MFEFYDNDFDQIEIEEEERFNALSRGLLEFDLGYLYNGYPYYSYSIYPFYRPYYFIRFGRPSGKWGHHNFFEELF